MNGPARALRMRMAAGASIIFTLVTAAVADAADVLPLPLPPRMLPAAVPLDREVMRQGEPLAQLIREALQNNPEIHAARQEHDAAARRIAPAGALDDPMIEAGLVSLPVNSFSLRREDMTMKMLGIAQRVPYPGKRDLRRAVAAMDAEALSHAFAETVNRVAREVRIAYYELALAHEGARLVQSNREVLLRLLRIAEGRYTVGQGRQSDVLKAQSQLSRIAEEGIRFERERLVAEAELNRALGREPGASAPAPGPLALEEARFDHSALESEAWAQRPQLLALRSVLARSERSVALARTDRYPDFDVRFSYGQRDRMPDGVGRSDLVSLTVAINLPVWRAAKVEPRIAEAQALHEQASSLFDAQRRETAMKLRQQAALAEQSLRVAKLYRDELVPQSRLAFESALAAYQVNRGEFMPLLENRMATLDYEIAYLTAVASYNKARAEIELLTGRVAGAPLALRNGGHP
jgi:outer membrane protein, heavy metal efflux system